MPMTASSVALANYTALPKDRRRGVGLCLSGGGYRAALFHLGAIRRLNEVGALARIDTISSVSGGSILSAFLAARLPFPLAGPVPMDDLVREFCAFTSTNIRDWPIFSRLLPQNWFTSDNAVQHMQSTYDKKITQQKKLGDLPAHPRFIYCSTDMQFGVNWTFERDQVGDYEAGYVTPAPQDWPLAKAVACSSCFPPVFNPMKFSFKPSELGRGHAATDHEYASCIADLRLTDGGVYDNLGLEPVWKDHQLVICSDGGGTFDFQADKNLVWRVERYSSIMENQVGALRKRWLVSNFISGELDGTYWGISSDVKKYDQANQVGYSPAVADGLIAAIRTDLDKFSEAEASVLQNHGYLLADAALRKHVSALLPLGAPAANPPYPQWMDEEKVKLALKDSNKRKPLGR